MKANKGYEKVGTQTIAYETPALINDGRNDKLKLLGPSLFQNDGNPTFVTVGGGAEKGKVGATPGAEPVQLVFFTRMRLPQRDDIEAGKEPGHAIPLAFGLTVVGEVKATHPAMGVP